MDDGGQISKSRNWNRNWLAGKTGLGTGKQTGTGRQAKPELQPASKIGTGTGKQTGTGTGKQNRNRLPDDVGRGRTKDWIMQQTKVK